MTNPNEDEKKPAASTASTASTAQTAPTATFALPPRTTETTGYSSLPVPSLTPPTTGRGPAQPQPSPGSSSTSQRYYSSPSPLPGWQETASPTFRDPVLRSDRQVVLSSSAHTVGSGSGLSREGYEETTMPPPGDSEIEEEYTQYMSSTTWPM